MLSATPKGALLFFTKLAGSHIESVLSQQPLSCSAMGGSVKFEDALEMRLAVMKTSHQNIQDFLAAHPPRISKGGSY